MKFRIWTFLLIGYMLVMFIAALGIIGKNNLPIRTFTWWDVLMTMSFLTSPAILGFYAGRENPQPETRPVYWIERKWREWFPSQDDIYQQGRNFVSLELSEGRSPSELWDKAALGDHFEPDNPFDRGMRDELRSRNL